MVDNDLAMMAETIHRKKRTHRNGCLNDRYRYNEEWVRALVERRGDSKLLLESRGLSVDKSKSLFYWEQSCVSNITAVVKKNSFSNEMSYKLLLKIGKNVSSRHKQWLEVKQSLVKKDEYGLFSLCRFDKGDAITVACEDELREILEMKRQGKKMNKPLIVGGGCAVDASLIRHKCNNAMVTANGVIRALQRIEFGKEVLVDYEACDYHPVMLLDVVAKTQKMKNKESEEFVIADYKGDGDGSVVFTIRYKDGGVTRIGEQYVFECLKEQETV